MKSSKQYISLAFLEWRSLSSFISFKWYELGLLLATITYGPSHLRMSFPSYCLLVIVLAFLCNRSLTLNDQGLTFYWNTMRSFSFRFQTLAPPLLSFPPAGWAFPPSSYCLFPHCSVGLSDLVRGFWLVLTFKLWGEGRRLDSWAIW